MNDATVLNEIMRGLEERGAIMDHLEFPRKLRHLETGVVNGYPAATYRDLFTGKVFIVAVKEKGVTK